MSTEDKEFQLNDEDRRLLAEAAKAKGKPWRTILREAIGELIGNTPDIEVARRQQEARNKLADKLSKLPVSNPDDGLSGRDHDQILYGDK